MITTDKDINQYNFYCGNCGKVIEVASNQPAGDSFPVMCECESIYTLTVPEINGKHLYKMRSDTFNLRKGLLKIFENIGRSMTVRQLFYQAVSCGLVPKDEQYGYSPVQRNILEMRRYGHLLYHLVSDVSTRNRNGSTYR